MTTTTYKTLFSTLPFKYDEKIKKQYEGILNKLAALPQSYSVMRELRNLGLPAISDRSLNAHEYMTVLKAFQEVYRPDNVSGVLDRETCALIYALSDKAVRIRNKKQVTEILKKTPN